MELSIDTLKIYERLKNANFDDRAAKELSEIFRDNAHSIIMQQAEVLATKGDIAAVKGDIAVVKEDIIAVKDDISAVKRDISLVKSEIRNEISNAKVEIIKWVAGMLVAQGAIVAALVKLL